MKHFWTLILALVACGEPLPSGPTSTVAPSPQILLDDEPCQMGVVCVSAPVLTFRPGRPPASEPRLVRGPLSTYERGRIDNPELPTTLASRLVPLHFNEGQYTALELLDGGTYTLSIDGSEFAIDVANWSKDEAWVRAWPGETSSRFAVLCAPDAFIDPVVCPTGLTCLSLPALPRCIGVAAGDAPQLLPPRHQGLWLPPTLLRSTVDAPAVFQPPACGANTYPLLSACVVVDDDRVVLQAAESGFWTLAGRVSASAGLQAGEYLVIRDLEPEEELVLNVHNYLTSGVQLHARPTVVTGARRTHVVISEVMANPQGPEPQQEWVELGNDGVEAVELLGWWLEDDTTVVPLPAYSLQPGAFVVIVADDFLVQLEPRLVPDENTTLLRVGKGSGTTLSNVGERLKLFDVGGRLQSSFPAIKAPSGISVARRSPDTLDEDPNGFGPHSDPGASPGAANDVR